MRFAEQQRRAVTLGILTTIILLAETGASFATSATLGSAISKTTRRDYSRRLDTSHATALRCLSLNSYHEARGEPFHGQVAVAQVVLRRARFDQRNVCRVVYAYRQFSWTAGKPPVGDRKAWAEAVRAAKVAMLWAHGAGRDYSAGADHYHTIEVCPRWSRGMRRVAVIGRHEFYRMLPPTTSRPGLVSSRGGRALHYGASNS